MSSSEGVLARYDRVATRLPVRPGRRLVRWGENLADARQRARRENGNRVSWDWIADQVSRLEPCARSDIKRLESLGICPTSPRDVRLAMYVAAYCGLGEDTTRTVLGVDSSLAGLDDSDLRLLSPAWPEATTQTDQQPAYA